MIASGYSYVQARLKSPAAHRVGGGVVSAHERAGKIQSQSLLGRIEHLFIFLQPVGAPRRHSVTKKTDGTLHLGLESWR